MNRTELRTRLRSRLQTAHSEGWLVWALFGVLVCVWGSSFILMKKGLLAFTPLQVGGLRMLAAGMALLPLAVHYVRQARRQYPWGLLVLVCLTGNLIPAILFPLATTTLPSGTVGTLNALTPLFTLLIGALFFGARFRAVQVAGVLIGLGGSVALILLRPGGGFDLRNLGAGLVVVLCTVLYGTNVNVIKRYLAGLSALEITSLSLQPAALAGAVILVTSDFGTRLESPQGLTALAAVSLLGVLGTAFALLLFYQLVRLAGPVFAASNTYCIPFVALLWGTLDGEPLHAVMFAFLAAILLGVWLVNRPPRQP